MTKEDIITTAIHEAFLCGKEAGEAYERAYHIMQKKVEEAKQGKPDHDPHMYDGIFGMAPNYRVKIDPESALNPDSKDVTFQVQSLPGQRIGDTPEEKIACLEHQCCLLKQENLDLQRQCEEKDATITILRARIDEKYEEIRALDNDHTDLLRLLEEKNAAITELRSQLEEYKDCSQEHFRKEIAERDNIIGEQDAELADLHRKYDELYATVNPLAIGPNRQAAPAEPSHYSEYDQVLVSGSFFKDVDSHTYHATILSVMQGGARVLITEKDSDFEDDEHYVPYEYITKQ